MGRSARRDFPGAIQHVFTRGLDREPIFRDDDDRQDLYSRMRFLVRTTDFRVLAWSFLPIHFHLLAVSGDSTPLSSFMRRVLTGYSLYFNEKHGRVGYLFQGRFGSRLILGDGSMKRAMAYVSANPLKHRICHNLIELEDYRWSSHREILERTENSLTDFTLAMALYSGGAAEYLRETEDFRFTAVADIEPFADDCRKSASSSQGDLEDRLMELLEKTAADSGVEVSALTGRGRCPRLSEARRVFVLRAVKHLGASARKAALLLCISPQRVSRILIQAGAMTPGEVLDREE